MKFDFNHIYSNIGAHKVRFFAIFFAVLVVTYAFLYALDFYPEPKSETDEVIEETVPETETAIVQEETAALNETVELTVLETESEKEDYSFSIDSTPAQTESSVLPNRIVIPKSGTDVHILNPATINLNDLDNALLSGVIRHPQSADLDDRGNMLILGHSSYLPNVFNKNFQAFNGIQDLKWGDQILVYGGDNEKHTYRVDKVYLAKASETIIETNWGSAKLTLVTCNSFASKDDRYIVEATLIGVNGV